MAPILGFMLRIVGARMAGAAIKRAREARLRRREHRTFKKEAKMLSKLKKGLLLRFIPQRTLFGVGALLLGLLGAFKAVAASDFCSAEGAIPAVCGFVAGAIPKVSGFLITIGILDRDRK